MLWLLGVEKPGEVDETAALARPDQKTGSFMDMAISLRTPGNQTATVNLSYNSFVNVYDYVLLGRENTLVVDGLKLRDRNGPVGDFSSHLFDGGRRRAAAAEPGVGRGDPGGAPARHQR